MSQSLSSLFAVDQGIENMKSFVHEVEDGWTAAANAATRKTEIGLLLIQQTPTAVFA